MRSAAPARVRLLLLLISSALTGCIAADHSARDADSVTPCQVLADPKRYDHRLLRISGTMSHGFEGFVLSDDTCPDQAIWLEYGGNMGSGTVFAGEPPSDRSRSQALVVEEVTTSLVDDYEFRKLDRYIQSKRTVHAPVSLVGRYFCGNRIESGNTPFYGGYGHLGGFSLLVIQRVVNFRPE